MGRAKETSKPGSKDNSGESSGGSILPQSQDEPKIQPDPVYVDQAKLDKMAKDDQVREITEMRDRGEIDSLWAAEALKLLQDERERT